MVARENLDSQVKDLVNKVMIPSTFNGEVIRKNKSFKHGSHPDEAILVAMGVKTSVGRKHDHCGLYMASTQSENASDASFKIKGKGKIKTKSRQKWSKQNKNKKQTMYKRS